MIIPNFAIMKKGEYIARYGWWASIVVALLSLMVIMLFVVGKVDDISVWLWLLVIIVVLNGFLLHRDYKRRGEMFCVNSDGLYMERKKKRLAIPWNQIESCYYRISIETICRGMGMFRIFLVLVVERKKVDEQKFKLSNFRFNPITIARCIDGCSGKRLFDRERTKRRFLKDFVLWILLPLLLVWAFWLFYKQ